MSDRFNHALWLSLLSAAQELFEDSLLIVLKSGYEFDNPQPPWLEGMSAGEVEDIAGAVDRLIARAERFGLVTATPTSLRTDSGEVADGVEYAVVVDAPYPPGVVGVGSAHTDVEESLLQFGREVEEFLSNLKSQNIEIEVDQGELGAIRAVVKDVADTTSRKAAPRSRVRSGLGRADRLLRSMFSESISWVLEDWCEGLGYDIYVFEDDAEEIRDSAGEVASVIDALANVQAAFYVISAEHVENQILVVEALSPRERQRVTASYTNAAPSRKGAERRRQRFPVVEVVPAVQDRPAELPTEVHESLLRDASGMSSWLAARLGVDGRRRQTRRQPLAGWHSVTVDPLGRDLRAITATLERASYLSISRDPHRPQ